MFFKKKPILSEEPRKKVVIIGDSPLAFLLACLAQNNNFDVSFLTSPQNLSAQKLHESLLLKTDGFRTKHFSVPSTDTLSSSPDFCVIASSPKNFKTDFLLSQNTFLEKVTILNFSHFYNHSFFEQLQNKNVVPCYSFQYLNFEKNTLNLLTNKIMINILGAPKEFSYLASLFRNPSVEIKNISASKPSFWKHFIPFFIRELLLMAYKKDISVLLNQTDVRKQISTAIDELCALSKNAHEIVKADDVLAFLYTVPDGYKSEFLKNESSSILAELLPQISYFETPFLFKLMSLANKS